MDGISVLEGTGCDMFSAVTSSALKIAMIHI